MYETSCQSRFDAQYWMLVAGALGRPTGMADHVDKWQNQYNIVKLKNKMKKKRRVSLLVEN